MSRSKNQKRDPAQWPKQRQSKYPRKLRARDGLPSRHTEVREAIEQSTQNTKDLDHSESDALAS